MKNKLLLGSSNKGKLNEIKFYLKYFSIYLDFDLITTKELNNFEEPTENALTFQENAEIKSQYYFNLTGHATISDDSGFVIDDLGNYPGVKTARVAKKLGSEQMLWMIFFKVWRYKSLMLHFCAVSLVTDNKKYNCLGKVKGKMISQV